MNEKSPIEGKEPRTKTHYETILERAVRVGDHSGISRNDMTTA